MLAVIHICILTFPVQHSVIFPQPVPFQPLSLLTVQKGQSNTYFIRLILRMVCNFQNVTVGLQKLTIANYTVSDLHAYTYINTYILLLSAAFTVLLLLVCKCGDSLSNRRHTQSKYAIMFPYVLTCFRKVT